MNPSFDRRLIPARPDLADAALQGCVEAARYVTPAARQVVVPSAPLRREPRPDAALDTEALMGEPVALYDEHEGMAWVQLGRDRYVGYLPAEALGPAGPPPTHRVTALRSFVYPGPDMKLPPLAFLSMGAGVTSAGVSGEFVRITSGGFVYAAHLAPCDDHAPDFVAVAERFAGTPYLWGGRTSLGIDCSGLVQLALAMAGIAAPRDTDMQQAGLGDNVEVSTRLAGLERGDLVFWRGHVGIMQDGERLLHANGHHMAVASERLEEAESRIRAKSFGPIVAVKRIGRPRS